MEANHMVTSFVLQFENFKTKNVIYNFKATYFLNNFCVTFLPFGKRNIIAMNYNYIIIKNNNNKTKHLN